MEKIYLFGLGFSVPLLKSLEEAKRLKDLSKVVKHPATRDQTVLVLKRQGLLVPTYIEKNSKMYLGFYLSEKGKDVLNLVRKIETLI